MVSKIATFRLPENLIQEIRSRAEATGRNRTEVVVEALKQAFGMPLAEPRPATVEELQQTMVSKVVTCRLPENLIQEIRSRAEATGHNRTEVVVEALKQAFGMPLAEPRPATVEELQQQFNQLEKKSTELTQRLGAVSHEVLSASQISQVSPVLKQVMPEGVLPEKAIGERKVTITSESSLLSETSNFELTKQQHGGDLPEGKQDAISFPSLSSLRSAHSELLRHHRESSSTTELLTEIEEFIYRGRATGALLDTDEDRWASQSLLDYWSAILYRAGREPPDATLAEFDPTLAPELDDARCPYLGLEAFREEKSNLFYGRQRLLEKLVNHLKENRLLAVVGSSGSGKSSVVLGGLLPKLKVGGLLGSENWHYNSPMVPGVNPLENLARITQPHDINATEWLQQQVESFQKDPNHLTKLSNEFGNRPSVLVVDQFEEVFTLCRDDSVRQAFIDNLIGLIQSPGIRHTVILTMRTDFESQVARVPIFKDLFEQAQVRVTALDASELREAIEKPAELVGLKFEEGLVEALLQDVLGEPAALPLLQFTLLKLWDNRERNRVTWETYKRLGGGRQALARSADEFYEQLIPEEQVTVKRILLRMVRPTEGLEVTSNRIQRKTLYQAGEARDRVDRVLDKLIEARLVRLTENDTPGDAQVEVAHETLVRNWPRLVEWLEDKRVNLRRRWRLAAAAEDWQARGRDKSILLRGSLLAEAQRYEDLNALEVEFIQRSVEDEQKVLEKQILSEVLKRVEANTHTAEDFNLLKQLLSEEDFQPIYQMGGYNVNIGEGTSIKLGDRSYVEWNNKAILALIESIQLLQSSRRKSSRWEKKEPQLEQLVNPSYDAHIELINIRLLAIEELRKFNQNSENQDEELNFLRKSFNRIEQELIETEKAAKNLLQDTVVSLELKLEELRTSAKHLLEADPNFSKKNSQIINLERQIDIVRKFESELEYGRRASIWLNNNLVLFSRTAGKHALSAYPEIKSMASAEQIEDFYFSIKQFLERVSHCLNWGRYNILDSTDISLIFNFYVYEIAFNFIKELLPSDLPDQSIKKLEDCIDYLIQKLPYYLEEYRRLENLLAAGRWREANEATRTIILKTVNREKEGWLADEQIQNFPCQVLHVIDCLWVQYSNQRFGFSVQKRIFNECENDPQAFGDHVGWRIQEAWISASQVIYTPANAPVGHLPWGIMQVITMDNAILNAFVKGLRAVTKTVARSDWQKQLLADFMAFGGFFIGDRIDKEEFKRNLEYELSHDEAWWEGQRLEESKVRKLFSLLVACPNL